MNKPKINVSVADPDTIVSVNRPTPQHDRLKQVRDRSQAIHEFILEFLPQKGIEIAIWNEDGDELYVSTTTVEKLIAEFFEIDLDELENEKRRMLHDIRLENARKDIEKELPLTGRKHAED